MAKIKDKRSTLKKIATMLGFGDVANKIIERDKKNTKAGKKAATTISN